MAPPVRRVDARHGYDLWAPTYEATPNPVVAMNRRVLPELLESAPGHRALDAACGTGAHFPALLDRGYRVIGADFSAGMLREAARARRAVPLVRCHLERPLPFASGSFDLVLCSLVGEHLRDLPGCFRHLARVLRPRGALVFTVYHPRLAAAGAEANFEREGVEFRLGAYTHTTDDYLRALRTAGFASIRSTEHAGDEDLPRTVPGAEKYVGAPLLLVLTAKGAPAP